MLADRLPAMCGSDTLTTVVSSTSIKVASITETATIHGLIAGCAAAGSAIYGSISPPVRSITDAVMKLESVDARNTKAGAISAGSAGRFMSVLCPNFSTFSFGMVEGINGVHTGPGATT